MRLILESAAALHRKLRKKMAEISRQRQVLCITHLPQIAAMADAHFEIEKNVQDTITVTRIKRLDEQGIHA